MKPSPCRPPFDAEAARDVFFADVPLTRLQELHDADLPASRRGADHHAERGPSTCPCRRRCSRARSNVPRAAPCGQVVLWRGWLDRRHDAPQAYIRRVKALRRCEGIPSGVRGGVRAGLIRTHRGVVDRLPGGTVTTPARCTTAWCGAGLEPKRRPTCVIDAMVDRFGDNRFERTPDRSRPRSEFASERIARRKCGVGAKPRR